MEKEIDLGEAISFWISRKGYLDLSTPEEDIIEFYKTNLDGEN